MSDVNATNLALAREEEISKHGRTIIERLRRGQLPQMVDWFDPGLLAKVGVRSVISATLGSYTDQRLIQAATDIAEEGALKARYNYSGTGNPADALAPDTNGAVWVDYVADLGDGFEATYAMACLLAADELKVRGEASSLPAGKLLIMGGDQVYPDATKQEYHTRLRDPYDWAFATDDPKRKLFAIPGNHDWYDGLSSFSALFCSARDRVSGGLGTQIGGWRCHQHRSYFAIKLPHNWWIWGPDIQLADNLDDSQRDYFDLMADQTAPGDNIILCLAEPSWLHKNYDNMHEISMLARKRGARICAVIAGDWHHYSRYTSDKLGIQFITCGGGGAFAHATHGLKPRIALDWATPTGGQRTASPGDTAEFNRIEKAAIGPGGADFTQNPAGAASLTPGAPAPEPKPITDVEAGPGGPGGQGRRAKAMRKEEIKSAAYVCQARYIYPPQWKSRLLSFRNLWLPFRNRRFAVLVGIVYFIYAWAWSAADPRQSPIMQKLSADIAAVEMTAQEAVRSTEARVTALTERKQKLAANPAALAGPAGAALAEQLSQAEEAQRRAKEELASVQQRQKGMLGANDRQLLDKFKTRLKDIIEDKTMGPGSKAGEVIGAMISLSLAYILDTKAFFAAAEQSPLFAFLLIGLWVGLVSYVELPSGWLGNIGKLVIGTAHFAAHIVALLVVSWLATGTSAPLAGLLGLAWPGSVLPDVFRVAWNLLATLIIGGLLGGLIMGLYWTLTCALFSMHTGDAFGALGLKDYKSFLRIKLEPDRATIYAIALDKVPGRTGWRWRMKSGEVRPAHHPHILPVKPFEPRLIEQPIVVDAGKVMR